MRRLHQVLIFLFLLPSFAFAQKYIDTDGKMKVALVKMPYSGARNVPEISGGPDYLENGGMQVQLNVMSKEQLIEAQKNPDKYRGLCVRVTGYSAYFVQMGKKAQDELIRRTEQA